MSAHADQTQPPDGSPNAECGDVAIVTGAGSGIGAATARRLSAVGYAVLCADQNGESAERTVADIRAAGGRATSFQVDVADDAQCAAAVEAAGRMGALVALCNIAGVTPYATGIFEVDPDLWDRVLAVNLRSVYSMTRHAATLMRANGRGVIVNTASVHAFAAHRHCAPYAASKGAVVALTRQLALDLTQYGIRVLAVAPGSVNSAKSEVAALDLERAGFLSDVTAVGRVAAPEEIAAVFEWACSDGASFINGTTLIADGGLLAGLGGSLPAE